MSLKKSSVDSSDYSKGSVRGDLEVKDAQLIFETVWAQMTREQGEGNVRFPKEIFWLNGSPGAGKGTQTRFIMEFRDLTAPPILTSELLHSREAERLKDEGMMAGDREVTSLVFRRLIDPTYSSGAIVDGYPRTKVQVECVKLLFNKLTQVGQNHAEAALFHNSVFHIIVLFIDEPESVQRQFLRGRRAMEHNDQVRKSGMGQIVEVRKTDLSEDAARNRYRTFKEITYEALKSLREVFHYHYINAHGTIREIQDRIVDELRYQSSLELDQATFDTLNAIPVARQIIVHARQELISRLEGYQRDRPELFSEVVALITKKFTPIIIRHSISGMAYVNSEANIFADPVALAMLIDIFSERGYHAVVDIRRYEIPKAVNPDDYTIITRTKRVFRFRISFPGSEIRRGR
jgi:adenylate kinase